MDDFHRDESRMLASAGQDAAPHQGVPSLLIRRVRDVHEPLVGKRARFLMTSHSPEGEWLAHGWKDGLRIVSEVVDAAPGLEEPTVWIQEERDFYAAEPAAGRFAVGVSRLWVEQYVSSTAPATDMNDDWLDNLNRDPNSPEIRALRPAEGHPDPVGARVVVAGDGTLETDLRAVGPVRMTNDGELAITVMTERDWYGWARDYPAQPHPTLRWERSEQVWVE